MGAPILHDQGPAIQAPSGISRVIGMISRATRWAKLERSVHAEWMRSDPTCPQRFKEAGDKFTQKVEDTLHLVGVHGVERPILHKGKQVYIEGKLLFENQRSEMILMRIAEARMPEPYKRRVEQTNVMGDSAAFVSVPGRLEQ